MAYSLAKKTETGWFLGREESTLFWSVSLLLFVQFLSSVWLFVTPWTAARQASLSFTISESSVRFVSIESVMLSNYLILCHPLLSLFFFFFFATLFSFCLKSFPTSGSFPVSQLFVSGGQSIQASASVLPMNIQDWFLLGWTGWISLQSKGLAISSTK